MEDQRSSLVVVFTLKFNDGNFQSDLYTFLYIQNEEKIQRFGRNNYPITVPSPVLNLPL